MLKIRTLLAVLALPLAASCTEFEFAEQDIAVRFDVEADVLEVSIDTRGIYGTQMGSNDTEVVIDERAAARVRQMAEGYRYFHLLTWPFVFDLDEEENPAAPNVPENASPELTGLMEDLLRLASGVTVTESKTYFDANDEVAVFQRVRIEHATELVAMMNTGISMSVMHSIELAVDAVADPPIDDIFESREARRLLLEHAKAERPWVELDGDGVSVHVPMTAQDLARVVRQSFDLAADQPEDAAEAASLGRAFFHDLDGISMAGNVVTFRFPFGDDGRIEMPLRGERHAEAVRLRAHF